jgi:histidine ammonia-lyase
MAHIGLALIGEGQVCAQGERLAARVALERHGLEPIELEAKEGLSIVNGAPCATGLAALALARGTRLLDWADALAACSFEALGGQIAAFDAEAMALHRSPGLNQVAARLRARLAGSLRLNGAQGRHTQDALSLRAVPQVHGAARDAFAHFGQVIDRELASVSDNPVVLGTPDRPRVVMEAHAVAAGVGLAMDGLAVALGEVAGMAERRLDRLVNPLISGLPPFLAARGGLQSGFMIAQYTAVALAADNRRRAAPASLDGGVTSGLQEDHLAHATPASLKALKIVDNAAQILAIEALAAAQASDLVGERRAAGTEAIHARLRRLVPPYADDRPLGDDLAAVKRLLLAEDP